MFLCYLRGPLAIAQFEFSAASEDKGIPASPATCLIDRPNLLCAIPMTPELTGLVWSSYLSDMAQQLSVAFSPGRQPSGPRSRAELCSCADSIRSFFDLVPCFNNEPANTWLTPDNSYPAACLLWDAYLSTTQNLKGAATTSEAESVVWEELEEQSWPLVREEVAAGPNHASRRSFCSGHQGTSCRSCG